MTKKEIWELWERVSAKFLLDKWYIFLKKNHYEQFWEIDLIFRNNEEIIFVEVKARTSRCFWEWFESVNENKLRKLTKTAELYCKKNWFNFDYARFDVISIEFSKDFKNAKIKHLEKVL